MERALHRVTRAVSRETLRYLVGGRSGPFCTIDVMLHSLRVIAVASILRPPTRPCPAGPAGAGQPRRRAGWGGCSRHTGGRRRSAPPLSPPSHETRMRRAVAGPCRRPGPTRTGHRTPHTKCHHSRHRDTYTVDAKAPPPGAGVLPGGVKVLRRQRPTATRRGDRART